MFSSTATAGEIWDRLFEDGHQLSAVAEDGHLVVTVAGTNTTASRPVADRREALVEIAEKLGYGFEPA